jgi:hypothetical protein
MIQNYARFMSFDGFISVSLFHELFHDLFHENRILRLFIS